MRSISWMLGLALGLATMAGCDVSNWCLHPFTDSCTSAAGGGSGSESWGQGATGVNVLDCMVGDNPDFPGRAYSVFGSINGTDWKRFGDADTLATGQVCDADPSQGNEVSINFFQTLGSGNWIIRVVKQRLTDSDGCSSFDMTGCSSAADDFQDFKFTADDGSPMATIALSEDF